MKGRFHIKTKKEIQHPELLRGALKSMGFLLENPLNGNGNGKKNYPFDLKIEDSEGHKIRGINLKKRPEYQ